MKRCVASMRRLHAPGIELTMALECSFSGLSGLDTTDIDAVQTMLNACIGMLLDPMLWIWAIVITVACALIGALIGWTKGRALAGMIWGLVLGPIGWIVIALAKSKLAECPQCGRPNAERAKRCRYCGVDFRKHAQRTVRSGTKADGGSGGW